MIKCINTYSNSSGVKKNGPRLRRGTNAERLTITPAEGELIYTTDTKKIFTGDGSTVGGNIVSGINNLLEDATPVRRNS